MAKKLSNIETVKAMVNANELETLRLATWGVQAYNVFDGQEYTNIITVEKRGGRYYFIDVVGNSIIISRYHDAERVCGEFIEHYNEELAVVRQYIDVMKKYGKVTIKAALWSKFVDECNVQGVTAEYVEGSIQMVHTAAEDYVIETHRLVNGGEDEPKGDNEPKDETEGETVADVELVKAPTADEREIRTPEESEAYDKWRNAHIDELMPFKVWAVFRAKSGKVVARLASRSSRHSWAISRIKREHERLSESHNVSEWQKVGKGYYFTNDGYSCMMCVTGADSTKEDVITMFEKDEPKADTANESTANECTATTSEEAPQAHNEPKADNYTANESKAYDEPGEAPECEKIIDSITWQTSDGVSNTAVLHEDNTMYCVNTGKECPTTPEEWANLCHVLNMIYGAVSQRGAA